MCLFPLIRGTSQQFISRKVKKHDQTYKEEKMIKIKDLKAQIETDDGEEVVGYQEDMFVE